ncbi:hypothetical protein AHAS_Ahas11G0329800 [Arachis hypogaea]
MFTKLMLGDYEVGVFEEKWEEIVGCFGVEDCKWIIDMYGKRNMWATTHIQEIFLLGLEQLQDTLSTIRKVNSYHLYPANFYVIPFNAPQGQHIEDIAELPKSLVLRRWTGKAKEGISRYDDIGSLMEDSLAISRHACLAHWCKQVMNKGCLKEDLFNESRDALVNILSWIRAHSGDDNMMEGMRNTYMKALKRMEVLRQRPQGSLSVAATVAREVITLLHVP